LSHNSPPAAPAPAASAASPPVAEPMSGISGEEALELGGGAAEVFVVVEAAASEVSPGLLRCSKFVSIYAHTHTHTHTHARTHHIHTSYAGTSN
jgi:hypothetical protein